MMSSAMEALLRRGRTDHDCSTKSDLHWKSNSRMVMRNINSLPYLMRRCKVLLSSSQDWVVKNTVSHTQNILEHAVNGTIPLLLQPGRPMATTPESFVKVSTPGLHYTSISLFSLFRNRCHRLTFKSRSATMWRSSRSYGTLMTHVSKPFVELMPISETGRPPAGTLLPFSTRGTPRCLHKSEEMTCRMSPTTCVLSMGAVIARLRSIPETNFRVPGKARPRM